VKALLKILAKNVQVQCIHMCRYIYNDKLSSSRETTYTYVCIYVDTCIFMCILVDTLFQLSTSTNKQKNVLSLYVRVCVCVSMCAFMGALLRCYERLCTKEGDDSFDTDAVI